MGPCTSYYIRSMSSEHWNSQKMASALLQAGGISQSEVTLSSGQKSSWYINGRIISGVVKLREQIVHKLVDQLGNFDCDAIAAVPLGALPLASWCAYQTYLPLIYRYPCENLFHRRIAIIEDTITTGKSTMDVVNQIINADGVIQGILCFADRRAGVNYIPDNIPFYSVLTSEDIQNLLK